MDSNFVMASCAGHLRLTNLSDLQRYNCFRPHIPQTEKLSWSCDDTLIASSGQREDIFVSSALTDPSNGTRLLSDFVVSNIKFANTTRHIIYSLDVKGNFYVHTLESSPKLLLKKLITSECPSSFTLNSDDRLVVVGRGPNHSGSAIEIYDNVHLMTSRNVYSVKMDENELALCLAFHNVNSHLLAIGTNTGRLSVADINTARVVQTFPNEEKSMCTGLGFSEQNNMAITAHTDGRLFFFDIKKNTPIRSSKFANDITSFDFFSSGCNFAIGTKTGRILIYDLRQVAEPVSSIKAHNSKVNFIACQRKRSKIIDHVNHSSTLSATPPASPYNQFISQFKRPNLVNSEAKVDSNDEIFSPAKPTTLPSIHHSTPRQSVENVEPKNENSTQQSISVQDNSISTASLTKNSVIDLSSVIQKKQQEQYLEDSDLPSEHFQKEKRRKEIDTWKMEQRGFQVKRESCGNCTSSSAFSSNKIEELVFDLKEQIYDERLYMQRLLVRQMYSHKLAIGKMVSHLSCMQNISPSESFNKHN